jgi:hypothetical protein
VWTASRKWQGNLVPLALWLPPTLYGLVRMGSNAEVDPVGVGAVALGVVLGWLGTNFFGGLPNRRMRGQLQRILQAKRVEMGDEVWFVGFATPKFSSALDPHEDVGFLAIEPERLRFISERRELEIARGHVRGVRIRANVHTLVGLGNWVSVEGEIDGAPIRLLVEPRERPTLMGNLRLSRRLVRRLREWMPPGG